MDRIKLACASIILYALCGQAQEKRAVDLVRFDMQGIHYRYTSTISVEIHSLEGELVPQHSPRPVFDDKNSFALKVDAGEVSVSPEEMNHDLNDYVFHYDGAPLSDLKISIEKNNDIKIEGKLHKGVPVPFSTKGPMSVAEGKVVIQAKELHALGIPAKDLLEFFGADLADLVNTKHARGVRVEKDRFILDPNQAFPAPHLQTTVREARIVNGRIVLVLGSGPGKIVATKGRRPENFQAFRGGELQFGKLIMHDTDLTLIDEDPRDAFDFFLDHYAEQLAAGYSKTLLDKSLKTYMPDYDDLVKKRPAPEGKSPHH
jgi:hypothetical protein